MESIGSIITRLMNTTVWGMLIKLNLVKLNWKDIVGDNLARVSNLEKIDGETAIISVSSPVWASQIKYMKNILIKKINRYLGSDIIKKIVITFSKR
jgi:predicted nucleic acid-binding Zn ribbon protein